MNQRRAAGFVATAVAAGAVAVGAVALSGEGEGQLALTKIAEDASTITLGWQPTGDRGYVFYADGVRVSWTADPNRSQVRISKNATTYRVESISQSSSGSFPTAAPPPGPQGYYWKGDMAAGGQDFSVFDMHDTRTNVFNDWAVGSTRDVTIVNKPVGSRYPFSQYSARVIVNNQNPSNSASGQTVNLWQTGAYGHPWTRGNTVWARGFFLIPDGTNPTYPGRLTPVGGDGVSSSWHVMMEWHKNDGAGAPGPTSTKLEIGWGGAGGPALMFKPIGGLYGSVRGKYLYETDEVQDASNGAGGTTGPVEGDIIPLKFNHWYEVLFRWKLDPDPNVGEIDGWVDGNLRWSGKFANMFQKSDGSVPGLSFQAGMYRNFPAWGGNTTSTTNANEHIYIGPLLTGPTRASVGA